MEGINLTPPQEIKRRKTQYVVGASTKISIVLLLIVLGASAYFFSKVSTTKSKIASQDSRKTELTAKREEMREVEDFAKKLSGKYFLLQKYLESRLKYSSAITELLSRIPEGVNYTDLKFEGMGKRASISGTSKDVVSVSSFVNRLAKEGNSSTQSAVKLDGKNAFLEVRLDSLNVEEGKEINYIVSFNVNEEAFLK